MTASIEPGTRFGRTVVAERCGTYPNGARKFRCRCDCGAEHKVSAGNLTSGRTKSCGCLKRENAHSRKHGGKGTLTYKRWRSMRARCLKKSAVNYPQYGGRGITICDRWLNSYSAFLEDMGECPDESMTLDRINNDLGYTPENCRWSSKTAQNRNKKGVKLLTHGGLTMCVSEWAERTGIKAQNILNRLRMGWTVERALTVRHDARAGRKAKIYRSHS